MAKGGKLEMYPGPSGRVPGYYRLPRRPDPAPLPPAFPDFPVGALDAFNAFNPQARAAAEARRAEGVANRAAERERRRGLARGSGYIEPHSLNRMVVRF